MAKIYPVIMSGGIGTRLWPLSTKDFPKQYQRLFHGRSSFEETLSRCMAGAIEGVQIEPPIIVGAERHRQLIEDHCAAVGIAPSLLVLEPTGRNTAPVAAIVAELVAAEDPDGIIVLMSADQHIADVPGFWLAVADGRVAAQDGHLTIFGITATRPETGFGYIRTGERLAGRVHRVEAFVEKPDEATARQYLAAGDHYWNAGIFMFRAQTLQAEISRHAPEIMAGVRETLAASQRQGAVLGLDEETFAQCPARSIDYAIMEKTDHAAVIAPVTIGWSDIGSWQAISDICLAGGEDNATLGDVSLIDSTKCYVRTTGPFVGAIGVDDLVIVATENGVLVTRTDQSQKVRDIVNMLEKNGRNDLL